MDKYRMCKICKSRKKIDNFTIMGRVCFKCQPEDAEILAIDKLIERKCLMCNKKFLSTGNRKCETCNSYYHDGMYSDVSSFISIGF